MASFPAKPLLVSLSLLLLLCSVQASYESFEELQVYGGVHSSHSLPTVPPAPAPKPYKGHHHKHHPVHPPVPAPPLPPPPPVHPPVHAPPLPPPPPVHPPVHPPAAPPVPPHPIPGRKLVAVQGVVYCLPCTFVGDNMWKAKPLQGAVVRLICNNTKYKPVVKDGTTDVNGYFMIMTQNVTNAASHKCRVSLLKSPSKLCDLPTNFKDGLKGATLTPNTSPPGKGWPMIYQLFNVGPFGFASSKNIPCPR